MTIEASLTLDGPIFLIHHLVLSELFQVARRRCYDVFGAKCSQYNRLRLLGLNFGLGVEDYV